MKTKLQKILQNNIVWHKLCVKNGQISHSQSSFNDSHEGRSMSFERPVSSLRIKCRWAQWKLCSKLYTRKKIHEENDWENSGLESRRLETKITSFKIRAWRGIELEIRYIIWKGDTTCVNGHFLCAWVTQELDFYKKKKKKIPLREWERIWRPWIWKAQETDPSIPEILSHRRLQHLRWVSIPRIMKRFVLGNAGLLWGAELDMEAVQ